MIVDRKNSLFTGKDLQQNHTQEGLPSACTGCGIRGEDRDTKPFGDAIGGKTRKTKS